MANLKLSSKLNLKLKTVEKRVTKLEESIVNKNKYHLLITFLPLKSLSDMDKWEHLLRTVPEAEEQLVRLY